MSERVQYKFMIPADLKERLEQSAHEGRRSLSAEIIDRLEASFAIVPKLEKFAQREEALNTKFLELQADLIAFMISQGKDPAEIRRMWLEEAKSIREKKEAKATQPHRLLNLDDPPTD